MTQAGMRAAGERRAGTRKTPDRPAAHGIPRFYRGDVVAHLAARGLELTAVHAAGLGRGAAGRDRRRATALLRDLAALGFAVVRA